MPSTAWTTPSSVLNSTTRSVIDSSGSGTHPPLGRVERVTQAVADEIHAEDDENERDAGDDRQPPLERVLLPVKDQQPERRLRRLNAEGEERQRRLDEDRGGDGERGV